MKLNIVANSLGGMLTLALNFLVVPIQLRLLGPEAFGLLSLVASLQLIFGVFDLGLSTTITREVARDVSADRAASRELIRSVSMLYWLVALVLGLVVMASSSWIAERWLNLGTLSPDLARFGLQVLAVTVVLRWPVAFYSGVIAGLQKLVVINGLKITSALIRLGGGLVVLLLTRSMLAFFWWLAISALIEVALYAVASYRFFPGLPIWPAWSWPAIRRIWRFSASLNVIAILALVFTQADRVLLSRLLPLDQVGYYSLAMTAATSISIIQGFVTSAVLPAMGTDFGNGDTASLLARYEKATQGLMYGLCLPVFTFVFFGREVLTVWVSATAAAQTYQVLAVLAVGFLLNAAVAVPYTLSIATGRTDLPLAVNLAIVPFYVLGLIGLSLRWGTLGAASTWLLLNVAYLFTLLPLVQKHVLSQGVKSWLIKNFAPFVVTAVMTFGLAHGLLAMTNQTGLVSAIAAGAVAALVYLGLGFLFLGAPLQRLLLALPAQFRGRWKAF